MEKSCLILKSPNLFHIDQKRLILSHSFIDRKGFKHDLTVMDNSQGLPLPTVFKSLRRDNPTPIDSPKYSYEKLPRGYRALKRFHPRSFGTSAQEQEEAKLALLAEIEMRSNSLKNAVSCKKVSEK